MKVVVSSFNQEKALVGAFFMIVELHRLIVTSTSHVIPAAVRNLYLLIISSTFADINRSSGPEVALLHQQTDSFI